MTEIIPAILPENIEELRSQMSRVSGLVPLVQVDVCDGKFVPHKSWPYVKGGMEELNNIVAENEGFPFWDSLEFEADLMVRHPEEIVFDWIKAGARRIVLHLGSGPRLLELVEKIRDEHGTARDSEYGIEIGVAVHMDNDNAEVYPFLDLVDEGGYPIIDFVQFMGIDNVGFQHQEFDDRVLEKISDLRGMYPDIEISVDGGVGFDNASDLISAGATRLISGSTIFDSEDVAEAIHDLRNSGE